MYSWICRKTCMNWVGLTLSQDLGWPLNTNSQCKYIEWYCLFAFCKVKLHLEVAWIHTVRGKDPFYSLTQGLHFNFNENLWLFQVVWLHECSLMRANRRVWRKFITKFMACFSQLSHSVAACCHSKSWPGNFSMACLWLNNADWNLKVFAVSSKSQVCELILMQYWCELKPAADRKKKIFKNKLKSLVLK